EGVSCEACHGPGARHVALSQKGTSGEAARRSIFNPATLEPVEIENFCGECHRTSRLVTLEGLHGLDTVHYEPYRLEMSQCWIMTRRISCLTCHDPHQPLQRNPAAYDAACLSCHPSRPSRRMAAGQAYACPVATHNCVTCHMPKCRLPRAPFSMSDHFIRIVASNDACSQP
ncbi:MAG: multiheme c-type cytochrome, partial [Terriglobia bacterium]